jgi:hypothetical protein
MQSYDKSQIESFVAAIGALHRLFEQSISDLRHRLGRFEAIATSEELLRRADYWRVVIAYDSSVRLRLIIENNFHAIETLALLATARYVFELSIWLKLTSARPEYALAYYGKLLEKEREHSDGLARQLEREIELLERLEEQDAQSTQGVINKIKEAAVAENAEGIQQLVRDSRLDVDRQAARAFSIYADRATHLGFRYTADLVRTQALKKARERQERARLALEAFRKWCPPDSLVLVDRRWKWDREALAAKMEGPYDFLYSYTSRLLHATPASVTTDVKNLECDEIRILLRYIHGALLDALDLTGEFRTMAEDSGDKALSTAHAEDVGGLTVQKRDV